jgi:peptide/nickel transport system permease protein
MSIIIPDAELITGAGRAPHGQRLRDLVRQQKAAVFGLVVLAIFIVVSLIAPLIMPYSPTAQTCAVFAPPSSHHLFGCDDGGIDLLSEIIQGGQTSLIIGFAATFVAIVIGGGVGLLSGYYSGWVDTSLMRVTDYLLVIPDLAFAMVIADVWGPSLVHVIIVIGILEWASTARVIRAQVMSIKGRVYIKRARAVGAGNTRIMVRHILPQIGPLLVANTVLTVAVAIYLETALAFLGLEDPSATTWGTILQNAFQRAAVSAGAWWAIVPDGIVISILITACFLVGRGIEDALNPRLRVAHLSTRRWNLRPLVGRGKDAV